MEVTLYSFSKRPNSTREPISGSGTVVNCTMRTGYSETRPKIEYRGDPSSYNYMKIGNNYYYIVEKTFNAEENFFIIEGERDALATFRANILASTQAILRTSDSDYQDNTVADGLAIPYAQTTKRAVVFGSDLIGNDFTSYRANQTVITAVAGQGFIGMDMSSYDKLISNMFYTQAPTDEIAKWVMNPQSWFIGQMGFPIIGGAIANSGIFHPRVAWWSMDNVDAFIPKTMLTYNTSITVPLHMDSNGSDTHYLNNPPYMSYNLYVGGFGQIPIDSNKVIAGSSLNIYLYIDLLSGGAKIKVLNTWGQVVAHSTAQMGYDVAMASRNPPNIIGTTASVLIGGAVGGVAGAIGGGIAALSSMEGAGAAMTSGSMGGAGGWIDISSSKLEVVYKRVHTYGNSVVGKPSTSTIQLYKLEGDYIECATGSVGCKGTPTEKQMIESTLKGGMYLE